MNTIAHEGFDFPRWMNELDAESRARLDRFLEKIAEVLGTQSRGLETGRHQTSVST
jgi:hypothetical protein